MVYLIGWALVYGTILLQALTRYRGLVFVFMVLVYFAGLAFLRGSVGTDTGNYELMIGDLGRNYEWDGQEPGFLSVGWLFKTLFGSTELAVRSFSLVFFGLLAIFSVRSTRDERFTLLAYFIPVFGYTYSMNVLRIGLAGAIFLLVAQSLGRSKTLKPLRWGIVAVFFHYSSIFSIFYLFISQRKWLKFYSTLGVLAIMTLLVGVLAIADEFFIAKTSAYQGFEAPGPLSGLGLIVPTAIVLLGMLFGDLPSAEKLKLFALGLLFLAVGWGITQFSYAGLRVLDLVAFNVPLSIMVTYSRLDCKQDNWLKAALCVAGLVFAAICYRNFTQSAGNGESPFLPYDSWL